MPPSGIRIRTTVTGPSIAEYAQSQAALTDQAMSFAATRIRQGLVQVNGVFYRAVYGLGNQAGRAFPRIYRDHLYTYMATRNINVIPQGFGRIMVEFVLDLGNEEDYRRGFHHNALIDTGVPWYLRSKKAYFERHPAKVGFPPGFSGQELLNTRERRIQWWQQAIIGGDGTTNVKQGTGNLVINVPTYEQVAYDRLHNAWVLTGKAPQWLILENGTFQGADPSCPPLHFSDYVKTASVCYAQKVFDAAMHTIAEARQAQQVSVATFQVGGRARAQLRGDQGRFTAFRDRLEFHIGNVTPCFGGL